MSKISREEKAKLLRYGELLAREAREEATPAELALMEEILKEFNLTKAEMINKVEQVVKKSYQ